MNNLLFVGGHPMNNLLFVGGHPMNNSLFVGGPPMNNSLFVGGPPMNISIFVGDPPTNYLLFIGVLRRVIPYLSELFWCIVLAHLSALNWKLNNYFVSLGRKYMYNRGCEK